MQLSSLELLLLLSAIIGNVALGIITFVRNPKSYTNTFFALFAFSVAAYLALNYFSLNQDNDQTTFLLVKMVMSTAAFINLFFFLLAGTYPEETLTIKKPLLIFVILFTIFVACLAQFNLVFSSVEGTSTGGFHSTPGVGMPIFLLQTLTFLVGGFILLIKKFKKSNEIQKSQIKMLFAGAVLMFSAILITNVVFVVVFDNADFASLLPLYTLIFMGFVSYAIVKHGLFNTRLIATEAFTVVIWVILFARIVVDQNSQEQVLDIFVFVIVVIFGILLMRTVRQEIYQRQRLSELTEKLKDVDIKKDEFLNVVAHELRAPMTAIKGYISMLIDGDTGQMNPESMEYLNMVFKSNDRLIRLVNNLLNVSRIEEGRQVYNMAEISLLGVIGTNFDEFKFTADEKHLQLKLDAATPLSDKVYVDTDRIYEVVANFISNAIKYTDQGAVTIRVTNPTPAKIKVEVTDTGRGINELDQQRLFQKYYRAEETIQRTVGTGLGLYISKLLIEKFGGTLGFTSMVGKGSTFWFELPLVKTSEERPNILV